MDRWPTPSKSQIAPAKFGRVIAVGESAGFGAKWQAAALAEQALKQGIAGFSRVESSASQSNRKREA